MFKVLVEFIYSRQKKKTLFHQNSSCRNVQHNIFSQCQLFTIFHLQVFPFKNSQVFAPFEIKPAPKKQSEKNQMIWDSFLAYLDTIKWRQRS